MFNVPKLVNKQVYVPQINDLQQINLFCNPNKELDLAANEQSEADYVFAKMNQNHLVP
jgi:hypothetical protein